MSVAYFDGRTSRRRLVELRFGDGLIIVENGDIVADWPFANIRRFDAPHGILRLGATSAAELARLDIRAPDQAALVLRHCPDIAGVGGLVPIKLGRIIGWSLAAAAAIIGTIWFGVPVVADQLTEIIPIAWEKPLGQAVDGQIRLLFGTTACIDEAGVAALNKLVARLQSTANLPIPPEPAVLLSKIPNAFALPGGRIYILSNLIGDAASPDELAGVLAHELGHVAHRDGVRRLLRDGGTGYLLGLLFGDVSGAGAALVAARTLLNSAYSLEVETAADDFSAMVMTRLGRPTAALGALLHRVAPETDTDITLFRDHPLTPDRERRLAETNAPATGPELLSAPEWAALRVICRDISVNGK